MGQALAHPITTKASGDGSAPQKGLLWGFSGMQGWRLSMEDAHFAIGDMEGAGWQDTAAFGVLDGHGGAHVANFCEHYLPQEISRRSSKDVATTLTDAFHHMDDLLRDMTEELQAFGSPLRSGNRANPYLMGCTANVCLVQPKTIVVANAGDTRAVLCRAGSAVPLSEDHKPNNPEERCRILRAGGSVERQQVNAIVHYRVNGNLNLSRSIGDLEYKRSEDLPPAEQMICSTPDIGVFPREAEDEFLLLACDGVWDVMSSQEAVDFVHERLIAGELRSCSRICEELLDKCVSPDLSITQGLGGDNMTVILVLFESGIRRGLGRSVEGAATLGSPSSSPVAADVVSPPKTMVASNGAHALTEVIDASAVQDELGETVSAGVSLEDSRVVPASFYCCSRASVANKQI
eukprot:TRINITY_DN55117_c0_g1_i1.p1 TRINITY_DN55117_c0_g1~~TRINITY_DN55117_c0_g1_i1.p1  ORF type:complete len:405 (+),score=77.55 TRINITY_DN55117_c0_g1_i1:217-1431(+)